MSSDNDNDNDSPHHSGQGLTLDLQGAFAARDDDTDTASQHSISFTSPTASTSTSPHHSPKLPTFSTADLSRRQSRPYTISTESSDDHDDASLLTGHASSFTSHGESALDHDEGAKQVPPTPLPAALERSSYPPAQPWSPGRSSVASLATSTSSYSKKARPESLLIDPPKGPLILGIALVDFNHQVHSLNLGLQGVVHNSAHVGRPANPIFRWEHLRGRRNKQNTAFFGPSRWCTSRTSLQYCPSYMRTLSRLGNGRLFLLPPRSQRS
jgi:hypothetical protein